MWRERERERERGREREWDTVDCCVLPYNTPILYFIQTLWTAVFYLID